MKTIARLTPFYLGQNMKLTSDGRVIGAVTPMGDAVVMEDGGDCTCTSFSPASHTDLGSEPGRPHRHVVGMFTSEQVRDAAIHSLCDIGGWTAPAGITPKVE